MKTILFLSRHSMTEDEKEDLTRIYCEHTIKQVDKTVESAEEIVSLCSGYDVLAAVLPISLYADLFKIKPDNLEVIFAKSKRVFCEEDKNYQFVFNGWMRITHLDCKMEQI